MRRWKFLAAVAGASVLAWWTGCSNPNLSGGKLHFDQASRLEEPDRTARFRKACDVFQQAVREMPQSAEARLCLGKTYAELDRPDSAGMNFDAAEKLDPTMKKDVEDVRDHYWSVKYNSGLGAAKAAIKARNEGNENASKAAFREALGQFYKSAAYSPGHSDTYTNIGKIYLNLAAVDSALTMLKKARSIAPNDPKVKDNLFGVYRAQADTAYQNGSAKLDASDSTAARSLFTQAAKLYKEADEIAPGLSDVNFQLGMTAYELSQLDHEHQKDLMQEAATDYTTVLKSNPADVDVVYNLTLVLRDLGRTKEARDYALRLVDLKPQEGLYRQLLGHLEDKLGNKQALLNGVVFGTALKSGVKEDVSQAKAQAEKSGADVRRRYMENGNPDEIRTFASSNGSDEYDVWFYWTRGQGFGFLGGKEKFECQFAPDGVLTVPKADLVAKGASKAIAGTIANGSDHQYTYVRAEFSLLDDSDQEIARVAAGAENLGPRGNANFEVPLDKVQERATKVKLVEVLGY